MPDDWNDEEYGNWEAPMKDNPAYKSFWGMVNLVQEDVQGFGFIGFDVWQVKCGTFFDSINITDDKAEADNRAPK